MNLEPDRKKGPEPDPENKRKPIRGEWGEFGPAIMLGMNCAVGMAVFTFLGYWLDQRRGGGLLFTLIGMILGLVYGGYEVWKVICMLNDRAKTTMRERTGNRPPPKGESS